MYNVVVIEDHRQSGTLLRTYIDNELERLTTVPKTLGDNLGEGENLEQGENLEEPPRNPKTGDLFENSCREPGQGQLVHLRHLVERLELMRDDPENEIRDIYPTARLFPLDALSELIQVAADFEPGYGHKMEDDRPECRALCEVVDRFYPPDILIVDLAMSQEEGERMLSAGGLDTFSEDQPRTLSDPRDALRALTGFKLLRAYARKVPVIVTSYWPNPLIAQHCLVNGAFAYVRKPVLAKADHSQDFRHAAELGTTAMDKAAKENASTLDVVVVHYLTDAVSEVLKAMTARWVSTMS